MIWASAASCESIVFRFLDKFKDNDTHLTGDTQRNTGDQREVSFFF